MKAICNAISKTFLITLKTQKNRDFFYLGLGVSAVNVGGTTIHSDLGIKLGIKLLDLNDKSKAALKNKLSEVKFLIIDELSMVSSDLWTDIDSSLGETFMMIPEKKFSGLSDMRKLIGELIFSQFFNKDSMKHLLGLKLWHLFK